MHTHTAPLPYGGPGFLEEAKRRLNIPELWERLNLPGHPGKSCRSPFRDDTNPSFSVFDDGHHWKDHGTGETGDAVDFLAQALRIPLSDAVRKFLEMAGVPRGRWPVNGPRSIGHILRHEMGTHYPRFRPQCAPVMAPMTAPDTGANNTRYGPPFCAPISEKGYVPHFTRIVKRINGPHAGAFCAPVTAPIMTPVSLPPLKGGTPEERGALTRIRKLPSEMGIALAVERGLLGFTTLWDNGKNVPAWIITDERRVNAQARRLDGTPWQGLPGTPKARTAKGACAGWPIGATDAGNRPYVILCEGGPDILAALTLVARFTTAPEEIAAIAVTGAGQRIHPEAIALLHGKHVRIVPHSDKAGASAAFRWDAELTAAGVFVDWFDLRPFLPQDGKDLNDALTHNADGLATLVRFAGEKTEATR